MEDNIEKTLKCPQCGANMELIEGKDEDKAICSYCGFSKFLAHELTPEEKAAHMQALSYEREKGRLKAEAEYEKAKRRRENRPKYIALAIIATPILIGVIIGVITAVFGDLTLPKLDPFKDAVITFTGPDGDGRAVVNGHSGVTYEVEDDGSLEEGANVTVKAESKDYFLTRKSEKVTVSGLDIYVTDLSQLDENLISALRARTAAAIDAEFSATGELLSSATKHYESYTWEPVSFDLVSDGKHENHVFDVIKLTFTRWDETVTRYAVYRFDGLLLRSSGIARLTWDREDFMGGTVEIGSMGEGKNPVWGTWMGVMTGFDTEDDYLSYVMNKYAGMTVFQRSRSES